MKQIEELPDHIQKIYPKLKHFANGMAAHYGCPVYLYNSALVKEIPRDWDFRMCVNNPRLKTWACKIKN